MIKLDKQRGIAEVVVMSLAPIFLIAPLIAMAPKIEIIALVIVAYLALLFFSLKNGLKPAAWIKNDTLYIRSGMMSEDKIAKDSIESMRYETGHTIERPKVGELEAHILYVDMKGYQEWPLTISDPIEHLDKMRLYHFISDNFWSLEEPTKANA